MTINDFEKNIRVIIHGDISSNTNAVLGPDSSIWKEIPYIKEVLMIPCRSQNTPLDFPSSKLKTVFIPLLEKDAALFPGNCYSFHSSRENLEILSNKMKFYQYMKEWDFTHFCPEHYEIGSLMKFPSVLKRIDLLGSEGVYIVTSEEDLKRYLAVADWQVGLFLLQEYIEGSKDYVSHLICRNGKILWHTSFEYGLNNNNPIRSLSNMDYLGTYIPEENILLEIESCLIPMGYTGPCNVDYKLAEDGSLKIFEINPRLGGSLMLPECKCYLKDAIEYLILEALNKQ